MHLKHVDLCYCVLKHLIYNTSNCLLKLDKIMHRTLSAASSYSELKIQAVKVLEDVLCTEDSNFSSIFTKRNQSILSSSVGHKQRNLPARIQVEKW